MKQSHIKTIRSLISLITILALNLPTLASLTSPNRTICEDSRAKCSNPSLSPSCDVGAIRLCTSNNNDSEPICLNSAIGRIGISRCGNINSNEIPICVDGMSSCTNGIFKCDDANDMKLCLAGNNNSEPLCLNTAQGRIRSGFCSTSSSSSSSGGLTGNWKEVGNNPLPSGALGFAFSLNNQLVLINPSSSDSPPTVFTSYNGDTWTKFTSGGLKANESYYPIVAHNDKLYAFTRNSDSTFARKVYSSTDGINWTFLANYSSSLPQYLNQVVSYNNKLWSFGGVNPYGNPPLSNDIFTSSDGVNWIKVGNTSGTIWGKMFVFNNKLYALGVQSGSSCTPSVHSTTDGINWTNLGNHNLPQNNCAINTNPVVFNNNLIITGGSVSNGNIDSVFSSDDALNWIKIANGNLPAPVSSLSPTALHKGQIYVIGRFSEKVFKTSNPFTNTAETGTCISTQWASSATASNTYPGYSPSAIAGHPECTSCNSCPSYTTWVNAVPNQAATVEVSFTTPTIADFIVIREPNYPGFVKSITLKDQSGNQIGNTIPVTDNSSCPIKYELLVFFPRTSAPVAKVVINTQPKSGSLYSSIDAVLLGCSSSTTPSYTSSSSGSP